MELNIIIQALIAFVAPLIGVFLGHLLSKRWDMKKEKRSENKKRRRVKSSLKNELNKIRKNITDWENKMEKIPNIYLPMGCYESSISSGNFSLIESDLQLLISTTYGKINMIKSKQYQIQDLKFHHSEKSNIKRPQDSEYMDVIQDFIEDIDDLNEDIEEILNKL